eukprot:gene929-17950_t
MMLLMGGDDDDAADHPVFARVAKRHRVRGRDLVGVSFPCFLALLCRICCDLFGDLSPADRVVRRLMEVVEIAAMTRVERIVGALPRRGRRRFS